MALSSLSRIRFLDFLSPHPGEAPRERHGLPVGGDRSSNQSGSGPPRVGEAAKRPETGAGPSHLGTNLDVTA